LLGLDQFETDVKLRDEDVIIYRARIGSVSGSSKGKKGGIQEVGRRQTEIVIWNTNLLDGTLNVYEEFKQYIELRKKLGYETDRFFIRFKHKTKKTKHLKFDPLKDPEMFFEDSPIGKNYFNSQLYAICRATGLNGEGVKKGISVHSLRATMIQWLLDAGHPATVIAKRTGHRDIQSLHSYNHLQSQEGINQQLSLFQISGSRKRNAPFGENQNNKRHSSSGSLNEVMDLVNEVTRTTSAGSHITLNLGNVTYQRRANL